MRSWRKTKKAATFVRRSGNNPIEATHRGRMNANGLWILEEQASGRNCGWRRRTGRLPKVWSRQGLEDANRAEPILFHGSAKVVAAMYNCTSEFDAPHRPGKTNTGLSLATIVNARTAGQQR
jgi:hypothetical protein